MPKRALALTVLLALGTTATATVNIAHAQTRTVYRCVAKDNTVSISTFRERNAKCEARTIEDTAGKPANIFGNLGVFTGNLYEGTIDGKPALTTRKTPGFTLLTRFTVETPKASPAHEGLGSVGKARLDAYSTQFQTAAKKHKIDEALLRAIAHAESSFNPNALSPKGAQGVMQLMPGTAAELKVFNPYDPTQSIDGGARMLKQLHARYKGDLTKTIAAYNAGPGAVAKYNGVPPYRETLIYVDKVSALISNYRNALGRKAYKREPVYKPAQ